MGDLLLSQALRSAVHPLSEISERITFTVPAGLLSGLHFLFLPPF
jgi:aspartate carbamoyltransferase catalytic subunit